MKYKENLEDYLSTYIEDPFAAENKRMLNAYVDRCVKYSSNKEKYLELGIGHGVVLNKLSENFEHTLVIEGAPSLVKEYSDAHPNVSVYETMFEEYEPLEKFNNIGMGFILEHVDDPAQVLTQFRTFLSKQGSIFVGVPSASSLHRMLANRAGLLDDIRMMSETDFKFGHKRFFTFEDWIALFSSLNFNIVRSEGLSLKPFSTSQLESLNLKREVLLALDDIACKYPEMANSLFFELKNE
ncbi:class I SAM-dependent methyltransferase [Litorilituus lipolyticus]|uniref:Class I SAM-dependent methyltransferase n=1 Tax=Litorilituus lipolyticus TaxID=2491017 RepID=A0A502L4Y3_9GAMM|nr:class I SAM-dependent methyltransferase [Litorilituus lipolyticus]TPH17053.1 class I SAM-dependent methyltransferase [Litorilituus lipolyticus]